jgi:hypothetical protein
MPSFPIKVLRFGNFEELEEKEWGSKEPHTWTFL